MATPESESFVRTFARGLKVIEVMGRGTGPQTLAEIAAGCELPRTAVRRFLMTLAELEFVRCEGSSYSLTPKVLRLGMAYLYTLPFWRQAQLVLEELCAQVGQSCAVSVLDGEDIVYVARVHASRILAMSPVIGSRLPAHAVSMGRVLLAGLPDAALEAYLAHVRPRKLTSATVVDAERIAEALAKARTQGWAWVDRELDESICGIAVPIRNAAGEVTAALNISLPAGSFSLKTAQQFLPQLRQAAARIRSAVV